MNNKIKEVKKKRSLKRKISFVCVIVFVVLLCAEGAARIKGYGPWQMPKSEVRVVPGGKYYQQHPSLGHTHIPGEYTITIKEKLTYKATHLADFTRATKAQNDYRTLIDNNKKEIWIFGCSFTYGWGVNDEETYAWRLQEKMPNDHVINFGVGGYGNVHSYVQLQENLKQRKIPKIIILAYAGFHDMRNTNLRARQKHMLGAQALGIVAQPYVRLNNNNELQYYLENNLRYKAFPFMKMSGLFHYIESKYNHIELNNYPSHQASEQIIDDMYKISKANKCRFILAGISKEALTKDMLQKAKTKGITTIDISLDLKKKIYNNAPYDSHPNGAAHQYYAEQLLKLIAGFSK